MATGAFDGAMKRVDGVGHMASPLVYNIAGSEEDLIKPAVNSTTSILQSILAHAPKVRRVVITSSFVAVVNISTRLCRVMYDESD